MCLFGTTKKAKTPRKFRDSSAETVEEIKTDLAGQPFVTELDEKNNLVNTTYPFEIVDNKSLRVRISVDFGLAVDIDSQCSEKDRKNKIQAVRDLQSCLSIHYHPRKLKWDETDWIYFIEHCYKIKRNLQGDDHRYSNKVERRSELN